MASGFLRSKRAKGRAWVLQNSRTTFYVALDLFGAGYVFTSDLARAITFRKIAQAKETVLLVCNDFKKRGQKVALRIERV